MISNGGSFGGDSMNSTSKSFDRYPVPTWKFGLTYVQPYSVHV